MPVNQKKKRTQIKASKRKFKGIRQHRQTRKRQLRGGYSASCDSAYVTESGFNVPANNAIPGLKVPGRKALLR